MTTLWNEYKRQRARGWPARYALVAARTLRDWEAAGGYWYDGAYAGDHLYAPGEHASAPAGCYVRLRCVPDDFYDDSYIDDWTDVRECDRERERAELWRRIERDGVWGIIGEFWNGDAWEHADSCFGLVGDDVLTSGYAEDIMRVTLDAYRAHRYELLADCLLYA